MMDAATTTTPSRAASSAARPRLLYVVTEDWYFLSHRLPMARAARDAGFEVHVAANVTNCAAAIAREGFILHAVPFARGKLSPGSILRPVRALRRVHREVKPAIIHHVALQASVLGALAAFGSRAPCVHAMTGLGFTFTATGAKARTTQRFVLGILRWLFDRPGHVVLVQNPDDRAMFEKLGIAPDRLALIPGSGVDTDRLKPTPEPPGAVTLGFVGRLLEDKGIRTLIEAHKALRSAGADVRLLIAGTPDPANPASVSEAEARQWSGLPGVTWLGQVADIPGFWAQAHIAVLPSRREGLPLSLLEAAACGRSMVATDVPGCREIVVPGETGLLVPADDAPALAHAIRTLAESSDLRRRYGANARLRVIERFSAAEIGHVIVALYRKLVAASNPAQNA